MDKVGQSAVGFIQNNSKKRIQIDFCIDSIKNSFRTFLNPKITYIKIFIRGALQLIKIVASSSNSLKTQLHKQEMCMFIWYTKSSVSL